MRQGQQNRRGRGRSRKPQNPLARNYESNGPDVKIRGTASHVAEKYMSLARDALASGDMVTAESYLQHAEHYNRIIMAAQSQAAAAAPQSGDQQQANGNVTRGRQNANEDDDAEADDEAEAEAVGESDAPAESRGRGRGRQRRNGAHAASEAAGAEQPVEAGASDGAEGAPEAVG